MKLSRLVMFMQQGYTGTRIARWLAGCMAWTCMQDTPGLMLVPAGCPAALDAPPFTSGPYRIDEVACHLGECPKYCCTPWHIEPKSVSTNCRRYHRHKHVFWKHAKWSYASDPP